MASTGILILIFTYIYVSSGSANNAFVKLQCKSESVGEFGQQSLLECIILTAPTVKDAKIRVVSWKKEEKALLVFNRGETIPMPGYSFAEPSWNESNMNVSLLINNTAVNSEGEYKCTVMTTSGENSNVTTLKVRAKYNAPTINSKPEKIKQNTDGTLVCSSNGGYPKGQLRWFDEHNKEWTRSAKMEAYNTESGLFVLSSKLTLLRGSIFSKYTCAVYNASGGREEETTFEITDAAANQGGPNDSSLGISKVVAPVVVIGSLVVGLLLVLVIRRRKSQQSRRHSTAPLMGDHHAVHTCESLAGEGDLQEMDTKCQNSLA